MDITTIVEAKRLPPPHARRALRVANGLTLQEVADVVGVTRQAIARWEVGEREPSGRFRITYAKALTDLRRLIAEEGTE